MHRYQYNKYLLHIEFCRNKHYEILNARVYVYVWENKTFVNKFNNKRK